MNIFSYKTWRPKDIIQFKIIMNVLVSSFWFIWIPMLWVYGHYNILILTVRGSTSESEAVRLKPSRCIKASCCISETVLIRTIYFFSFFTHFKSSSSTTSRELAIWGRARYISVTGAPQNIESSRVSEEETFCFLETWRPEWGNLLTKQIKQSIIVLST